MGLKLTSEHMKICKDSLSPINKFYNYNKNGKWMSIEHILWDKN